MSHLDKPVATTLDANVCIKHALYLGSFKGKPLRDYYCSPVRAFVNGCIKENIPIGYFLTEMNHSYKNLVKEINELGQKRGVDYYERQKYEEKARENLDRLFQRIVKFEERYSEDEIKQAEAFYQKHKKDLSQFLEPGSSKSPIPEEHDLILLVSANNLSYSHVHIVSGDTHFTAYSSEIPIAYNVSVIATTELLQILNKWSWPIPN